MLVLDLDVIAGVTILASFYCPALCMDVNARAHSRLKKRRQF